MKNSKNCRENHECSLFCGVPKTEGVKSLVGSIHRHHFQGGRDNDEKEGIEVDHLLNSV